MPINAIHIICLDQPYPPVYGGAIDMYYKIKVLNQAGVKVILHIFLYHNDEAIPQIEELSFKTYYYKRKLGVRQMLSLTPYIVKTRHDDQLISNLLTDNYPILFEGLHTCSILADKRLSRRIKMVRTHNVEHSYYRCLADYPNPLWKKLYYRIESFKLRRFESKLSHCDRILAISESDTAYYKQLFPKKDVRLLNCFFDDSDATIAETCDTPFVLYQGNIAVEENAKVVRYILNDIVPGIGKNINFIIAGANPPAEIVNAASQYDNVKLIANPDNARMSQLIAEAQVHLLLTFQPTGIKLKLLTALYKGRGHCIVNKAMLQGNRLGRVCIEADDTADIIAAINQNINVPLSMSKIRERKEYIHQIDYNKIENIIQQ